MTGVVGFSNRFGDNWGALPSLSSIAGYGATSSSVPDVSLGTTSQGAPTIASAIYDSPVVNATTTNPSSWYDGMVGGKNADGSSFNGWGGLALGAAQGLFSGYMGMSQYELASKQYETSKANIERNYAAQRTATNTAMEDRQRARVASNAGAYQSVGEYMSQNRIA
jgi:hypothetical protein